MQGDFHYYATYCAAVLAGYDHKNSVDICHAAQLVDHCSRTWLIKAGGPTQPEGVPKRRLPQHSFKLSFCRQGLIR